MSDSFGLKIGVEGEKEFKKALSDINQSFKVLGSEMKLVTSQFDKNDSSVQAVSARHEVLSKQIEAQKEKIETLRAALKNASESFGENDRRTQAWQIQLNNAEAALNDMERQMQDTTEQTDDLSDELDDAGDSAEESGEKFSNLGGILKGLGAALGGVVVAAGAAAVGLGKEVVQAFGELEQNLGGSEAVFGEYATNVQKNAEDAYKNMGTSQSAYLATANKMGALFQGSGLEQQRAMDLTTQAMQRAADMASVMGIDMEMALESVAGAAKGNFTMMDNLGVAMNATAIEAYAAAKGLDFVWASASQAEKTEMAMQMFFENTAQYAGNFARESTETVSGSMGLMSAAFDSWIAGLGNADADMTHLTENMVDAFNAVVTNLVPVIDNLVSSLPIAMDAILIALGELLPSLLGTVTDLFGEVLNTLVNLFPQLIPAVVDALITITDTLISNLPLIVSAAMQIIVSIVDGIATALPALIPAAMEAVVTIVKGLIDSLPLVLDAALQLITGLTTGILDSIPVIVDALPEVIGSIITFLINAIPQIIQTGITLLTSLVSALPKIITTILKAIPQIIDSLVTTLLSNIPLIIDTGVELLVALIQALPEIITTILTAIPQIVGGIVNALIGNIDKIIVAGVQLFVALIKNLPTIIVEIVKAVPQIIAGIVGAFNASMGEIVNVGANIVRGLWQGIQSLTSWLWNKVSGWINSIWDGICDFFGIRSPSREMAWVGEMLVKGLSSSLETNGDEAVRAAEAMSADISNVFTGLASDMETALPTNFSVNAHGSVNGMGSGVSGQTVINIYPQTLDQATIDYLFLKFNARLGAAI